MLSGFSSQSIERRDREYAVNGMSDVFRKPDPKGRLDQDFANRSQVSIELAL
jgi:hypothetical protein